MFSGHVECGLQVRCCTMQKRIVNVFPSFSVHILCEIGLHTFEIACFSLLDQIQ